MLNVDDRNHTLSYFSRAGRQSLELPLSHCRSLVWNAGAAAGAVKALFEAGTTPEMLEEAPGAPADAILREAVTMADTAVAALPDDWRRNHE